MFVPSALGYTPVRLYGTGVLRAGERGTCILLLHRPAP